MHGKLWLLWFDTFGSEFQCGCRLNMNNNTWEIKRKYQPAHGHFRFHFSRTEIKATQSLLMCATLTRGSVNATITHLVGFGLLLLLLLLLLVFFLVSAVTSFGPGCARLAWPGLPGGVPSTFAIALPRIRCVRIWVRVDLEQGEAGGRGRDSDHCRWCHCDKREVANNKRGRQMTVRVIEESLQENEQRKATQRVIQR